MLQGIILVVILVAAVFVLARHLIRELKGEECEGCGACDLDRSERLQDGKSTRNPACSGSCSPECSKSCPLVRKAPEKKDGPEV